MNTREKWEAKVKPFLVGRKITGVRYLTKKEVDEIGWGRACIVLILDNGEELWASSDDEGNDAGALMTTYEELPCVPAINE
jgi:hypothetical protein